ncbi:Ctf18p [Sporobolomyces koalae]|uniref:Ctf18p n=1 Tax=Sporobolomyces koalae TaxID=500713 RepID=UPI00317F9D51
MATALAELNRPPHLPRSTPRKQAFVLEEDPDFFANDEPEPQDEEQPPSDIDMDEHEAFNEMHGALDEESSRPASVVAASTSTSDASSRVDTARDALATTDEATRPGTTFEPEDDFGEQEFISSKPPVSRQPLVAPHDYASRYGSVSSLNLGHDSSENPSISASSSSTLAPGWMEQLPFEATTLSGTKISFRRKKRLDLALNLHAAEDAKALANLARGSLEKPFHSLVQAIESDAVMLKKQQEADKTSAAFGVSAVGNKLRDDKIKVPETQLWTDRYRPKRFTDLLGDERVHRSALSWLKEWDECVFKRKQNSAGAALKREKRKRGRDGYATGSGSNAFATSSAGNFGGDQVAPDPYGRPQEKILLLSGPPGLGKTTLAHVLARQAGYQVHEVNASDDRTAKVVEERVRNALDSTSLSMGWNKKEMGQGANGRTARPTCVVVDEIDGAANGGDSSFIKTLVKMVTEGSSTKKPSNRKNGSKAKKDRPLLRPIICICNDLYAPVLRPLRPLAKIIRFQPPTNTMLTKRLRTICEMENMRAENKHLTLLVDTAEGDLRSCLNTLQFIKRRGDVVDEQAIRSTSLGMKDTGTSSIQVLDRLFKKPSRKKGVATDDKYVARIVRDVQTSGEYEKIAQGCFENYLLARDTDNESFSRLSDALDWLHFFDRLDDKLRADRDYELLGYVPYSFVPWYPLFSSQTPNPVELPKTDYEMYLQRTAHEEIANAFSLNLPFALKNAFTGTTVVSELLPLFNRIVAPDLKPVNSQVVKSEERERLMRTVNTMILTKTTFAIDKNEEGQLSYKLDPPIDVFVHYEGKRATDIAPGRYAVRQMINREVEAELLRRGGQADGTSKDASAILSAYSKTKTATAIAPETKQAVDFFGRAIVAKPLTASQEAAALLAPPPRKKVRQTMYKFNEGFSNAVRTTKRVSDFFA